MSAAHVQVSGQELNRLETLGLGTMGRVREAQIEAESLGDHDETLIAAKCLKKNIRKPH